MALGVLWVQSSSDAGLKDVTIRAAMPPRPSRPVRRDTLSEHTRIEETGGGGGGVKGRGVRRLS